MIDYVILDITHVGADRLKQSEKVNFYEDTRTYKDTGEVVKTQWRNRRRPEETAKFGNLVIHIYKNGEIQLKGSLHKFHNQGKHNHDDFTIQDFKNVINELKTIGIDPEKAKIRHLEFAVNVMGLPYESSRIIKNLMIHKGCGAAQELKYQEIGTPSEYKTIVRDNFKLKFYDKALQYGLPYKVFRYEVKQNKASALKNIGLSTLSDLTDNTVLAKLGDLLVQRWDEVILSDWTIRKKELTRKEIIRLNDYRSNKDYWPELYKSTKKTDRNKFARELNKYKKIVQNHSENVHGIIRDEIINKWCKITTENQEDKKTGIGAISPLYILGDPAPLTSFHERSITGGTGQHKKEGKESENLKDSFVGLRPESYARYCPVTGVDISGQKEGSRYLREKTLKDLADVDPLLFAWIKWNYGPVKKTPRNLEEELEMIAKNIRNTDSNPRASQREHTRRREARITKATNKYLPTLFPIKEGEISLLTDQTTKARAAAL